MRDCFLLFSSSLFPFPSHGGGWGLRKLEGQGGNGIARGRGDDGGNSGREGSWRSQEATHLQGDRANK